MKWWRLYVMSTVLIVLLCACAKTSTIETFGDADTRKTADVPEEDTHIIIGGDDLPLVDAFKDTGLDWGSDTPRDEDILDLVFEVLDTTDSTDLPDIEEPDLIDTVDLTEIIPDIPAELPDCTPQCTGKVCGTDGCDDVCGYCAYGEICSPEGQCVVDICPKQCEAEVDGETIPKECGIDGCGGYCGFCVTEGDFCGNDGFCYGGACEPDCDGKACGPDGCGSTCGFCQALEMCNDDNDCVPHPCGDVTYKGKCDNKYLLLECVEMAIKETMCKSQPGKMCGWDEAIGTYTCVEETECVPECAFDDGSPKECGPDGCWGTCGICPEGWGCGGGLCLPAEGGECAWIDSTVKTCVEHAKWFCSADLLYSYDCMVQEEKTCAWDPKANFGLGGYDCVPL